jgi:hypothetical protein
MPIVSQQQHGGDAAGQDHPEETDHEPVPVVVRPKAAG